MSAVPSPWRRMAVASFGPVVTVTSLVIGVLAVHGTEGPNLGEAATIGTGLVSYAVAGGLILWHRPRHAVGWLLTAVGAVPMLGYFAQVVADRSSGLVALVFGLASSLSWMALFAGVIVLLVIYPSGRPLSRRWSGIIWLAGIGAVAGSFPDAKDFDPGFGEVLPAWVFSVMETLVISMLLALAGSVVSVVVRFRRAGARERAQLRLFLAGVVVTVAIIPMTAADSMLANVLFGLALLALPAAITTAVIRHQLYDIDRAVKRTAIYAVATGLLVALYAAVVLGSQALLGDQAGGSDLVVAGTTLLAAALFRPVASRLQSFVDRRFNRARYDAQRTAEAFGSRLRDELALDQLTGQLGDVVGATVAPAHLSLWLREATT